MLLNWFLVFIFMRFMIDQSRFAKTLLSDILLTRRKSFESWRTNDSMQSQNSFESSVYLQHSALDWKSFIWLLNASHCFIVDLTSWELLVYLTKKLIIMILNAELVIRSTILISWFQDNSKAETTCNVINWLSIRFFHMTFAMCFKHSIIKYFLILKYKSIWILFQFSSTLNSE